MSDYYTPSGAPSTGSAGDSAVVRGEFLLIAAGFDKLPALSGNAGKVVVINGGGTGLTVTTGTLALAGNLATTGAFNTTFVQGATISVSLPTQSGLTLATLTGTETFTNKRVTPRVVAMADATSFTPTGDSADVNTHANTQGVGTLTVNAPSGTPTDGQRLVLRVKSTNVQTYSWNAIYRGSVDIPLPTASSGASKADYMSFIYNSADTKWDLVGLVAGF